MTIHAASPSRPPIAPIDAVDQFIQRKRRAIEGLLKMAVTILPRAYDCGLFFNEVQTFSDAAWPFDVWIDRAPHSIAFVVRAGRWEAVIDFHGEGDREREAERKDRMRALRSHHSRGRL